MPRTRTEECFPAILRGEERAMLGVSVPELGREKAFVKVVAKLLGLKFDQLWDRHRRRQRRQRLFRGLMAAAFFLAAAVGGFAYWDYHRTKVAYYADYVECRGVPQGIGELSAAQFQRRHLSWKFESSRYRVDRVRSINGSGAAASPTDMEDADRPADRTFYYRDNGALEYAIEFTPTGKELRKSVYAPDLSIVEFKGGSKGRLQMQAKFLPADRGSLKTAPGMPDTGGRSEIAAWELKYDDLGRVVRRTYLNQSGYPTSDANGIYVQEFTYTPAGKVKAIRYLDIGGQPCPTKRGVAGRQYEYDAQGNRIQTTWIGRTGTPALNEDGDAIEKQEYDADGNLVEVAYFGIDGKPCASKNGDAGWKVTYDERGNRTSASCFGADGKPCLHKEGYCPVEGPVRPTGIPDKRVLPRDRRQALPEQGRVCRMEAHLRPTGKHDKRSPTSAPTASPVCTRTGMPVEGHLRPTGKPDACVLLRDRRQALPEQRRVRRIAAHFRRAGKRDR